MRSISQIKEFKKVSLTEKLRLENVTGNNNKAEANCDVTYSSDTAYNTIVCADNQTMTVNEGVTLSQSSGQSSWINIIGEENFTLNEPEEFDELNRAIEHDRDLKFTYAGLNEEELLKKIEECPSKKVREAMREALNKENTTTNKDG